MVDPQESSGHDNLTIRRFSEHISDPAKSKVLAELVAQAITKSEPAIQWRRKHIAHRDLAIALGDSAARLPRLDKSIVEDSVVSLRAVFDWIHFNCFDQRVFHYQDARYPGDALNLLEHLQEGVSSIEERFRRLENGMALPSDYGPRRAP